MNHPPAEAVLRELVEFLDRGEILLVSRFAKLRIVLAQIIARKPGRSRHAAGQQPAAQRAVGQHGDVLRAAIGKHVLFDGAFEQIVGRLRGVQRRYLAKFRHLRRAEIADADGANLSGSMQFAHGVGDFRDRGVRIRPVHLIEIDDVGLQTPEGRFGFRDDPCLAGVAKRLAVFPVESDLGGDEHALAPTANG